MRASASGSSSPPSGVLAGSRGSPKLVTTFSIPHRLAMATPFHRPSPWCASAYPALRKASVGASGSASLVSCMSSTSGRARSSHQVTFSRRAFSELTFQVAIRTGRIVARKPREAGYPAGIGPHVARRLWHPRDDHRPARCSASRARFERDLESVGQRGERRVLGDETGAPSCVGLHGAERGPRGPVPHPRLVGLSGRRRRGL